VTERHSMMQVPQLRQHTGTYPHVLDASPTELADKAMRALVAVLGTRGDVQPTLAFGIERFRARV
jgi:hypothetical protein